MNSRRAKVILGVVMVVAVLIGARAIQVSRDNTKVALCNEAAAWQNTHVNYSNRALHALYQGRGSLAENQTRALQIVEEMIDWQLSVPPPEFTGNWGAATLANNQNWANNLSSALGLGPRFPNIASPVVIYQEYDEAMNAVADECSWSSVGE
jgi:hypothetical protein